MVSEKCEGRKLGPSDCWFLDNCVGSRSAREELNSVQTLINPGKTTQGYLFTDKKKINVNSEIERFGLPQNSGNGYYGTTFNALKPAREKFDECIFDKVAMISNYKNIYISPLHKINDRKELTNDMKEILKTQEYGILFEHPEDYFRMAKVRPCSFKCFLGINKEDKASATSGKISMSLWETFSKKGGKHSLMFMEELRGVEVWDVKIGETRIRQAFEEIKDLIMKLYYPKKVLDVLGE